MGSPGNRGLPSFSGQRSGKWLSLAVLFLVALGGSWTPLLAETEGEAPAFSDFDGWWKEYTDAAATARPALVKKGTEFSQKRRDAMLKLIESDPAAAIKKAFPEEYHSSLPKPIQPLVEAHIRGLAKLVVTKSKDGTADRRIIVEDQRWKAFLYGPRLELESREEIPIHGVALEDRIAVDGSPLERFPNRESLLNLLRQGEGKKSCPICDEPGTIPTAVGDILLWFDTQEHLDVCEKALIEKEASPDEES